MKKLCYDIKQRKKASTFLALTTNEIEAAELLIEKELFRQTVIHLYSGSFYISQALLCKHLKGNPTHAAVDSELHRSYGRKVDFPRRYIKLHSDLHKLRTEINYRSAHTPEPWKIKKYCKFIKAYFKFARYYISEINFDDILRDIVADNGEKIRDFSIDIYCPKTYSHHVRFTAWFPPFYLGIFNCEKLARRVKILLKELRVKNHQNYVAGLNSKVDQYSDLHLLMIDIDSLDAAVEETLKKYGGILIKSGRGFHFLGKNVIEGKKEWSKTLRGILRNPVLKHRVDRKHIAISLNRGYSTLRITTSPLKLTRPQFFKEL
jgi:uncharacterized protein (UPF0332 family)